MKVAIIPDVHLRVNIVEKQLEKIENFHSEVKKIIFLGDYFDNFDAKNYVETMGEVILWTKDPKNIVLFGNHDLQYFTDPYTFTSVGNFLCSGYNKYYHQKIWKLFEESKIIETREKMKSIVKIDNTIFSHAGVKMAYYSPIDGLNEKTIEKINGEIQESFYFTSRTNPYYNTDNGFFWNRELNFETHYKQIFGHTPYDCVRMSRDGMNICVDCNNFYYFIYDTLTEEIEWFHT